jgi:PAS domain S-box-containing protein
MQDKHKTKAQLIDELESLRAELRKLGKAQQELQEARDYLENVIESSLDCVVVSDNDGCITKANKAFLSLIGYTADEVVGKMMPAFTPTEAGIYECCTGESVAIDKRYFDQTATMVSAFLKDGKVSNWETYLLAKSGKLVPVDITIAILYQGGERVGSVGILRDITGSKRVEEALLESEERFRSVVNNVAIGISLISPNMEILSLNNQMQQWFPEIDASKKPVCYKAFNNPPRKEPCSYCPTIQTLRDGQIHESTTETPRGDKTIHYRIISSPLKDKGGRVTSAIEMVDDITERRHAEEKILEYQNQLKSLASQLITSEERNRQDFAAFLHDQIGQSLCTLKIKLEMLQESKSLEESRKFSSEMLSTTAELIENTRSMTYELNPPVLHELGLGAGLEWLAEQMYKREGVIVQFEDDGQPRSLEKEMNILLFNAVRELLINVAKHARADNVKISLQSDQAGVRICVEDNGIGFNAPETGLPASKSNSFGLFSIKERLNYVDGTLEIKTAPGKGTRITLRIPHKQS